MSWNTEYSPSGTYSSPTNPPIEKVYTPGPCCLMVSIMLAFTSKRSPKTFHWFVVLHRTTWVAVVCCRTASSWWRRASSGDDGAGMDASVSYGSGHFIASETQLLSAYSHPPVDQDGQTPPACQDRNSM